MSRILRSARFAFSTLVGPWVFVPVLAISISGFLLGGSPFIGEGMWTIDWFANFFFATSPLIAAAAAVDTARQVKQESVHLVLARGLPSTVLMRIWAWSALPAVCVHVLVIAAGLGLGQVIEPSVSWGVLAAGLGAQVASFLCHAAVGVALGVYIPPLLAGLVAGLGTFAAALLVGQGGSHQSFRLLDFGGATVSRIGWTYDLRYVLGQGIVFVVATALLLAAPWRVVEARRQPRFLGAVALIAAVGVLVAPTFLLPAKRNVATDVRPTYCLGTSPQVCFYPEHRKMADAAYPIFERLFRAAKERGYQALVPRQAVLESNRTWQPDVSRELRGFGFGPSAYESKSRGSQASDLVGQLVSASGCRQLHGAEPPKEIYWYKSASLRATWLTLIADPVLSELPPDTYTVLTPGQVELVMQQFAQCDLYAPLPPA